MKIKKSDVLVYVAGKLSDIECTYLQNVSKNIKTAIKIKQEGYSVFIPSLDLLAGIVDGGYEYHDYADNTLEIMKRCDILFLGEGWENSQGCLKEIDTAKKLNIPIVFCIENLDKIYFERYNDSRQQSASI